ncbi:N-acetyl-D-Glu racemase DgcA [Oharaeibacter diazotrophicus]|uniref:Dipeptide epimerase n=2 Tax=Oharaeibacter diazotrophicus TaxID=1920512 RepID=A0A4R6RPA6_9HYPH|nr:N-acetyl-D-Glu racemase DgcA [Oharaeibacter diazotrophicus]TDP87676.1 L-alanine-DL-glutamate epimerase-like enolase superfamily enzyme [Oharaeibacter diazotrophicus]BBE74741.1 L-Ala-D/L-Glu epimerase [Pleomorphomonas sp. SM30]GLS77123.1 dipeptide epimerase [Oharaeibacter diazotrophicus]
MRRLDVTVERFPIRGAFTIARGSKTESVVVLATLAEAGAVGRGECVPYARYGESVEGVVAEIERHRQAIEGGVDRATLARLMPAGAARNAVDCALLDLEAKRTGTPAAHLLGLSSPGPVTTAYTLSLAEPEAMRAAAAAAADRPLLKIKLGGAGDVERLRAVRAGAPASRLIVDANEGWSPESFPAMMAACVEAGVSLIEQPLPAGADDALAGMARPVPVCADESAHTSADVPRLARLYDAVNVKLDKTGGITEAVAMVHAAEAAGLAVMVGCMLATSLAMAPALLIAGRARWVDLDGPLLLARDRAPGLVYDGSTVLPPSPDLWG